MRMVLTIGKLNSKDIGLLILHAMCSAVERENKTYNLNPKECAPQNVQVIKVNT